MKTKSDTDLFVKSLLENSDRLEKKMNDIMKWKYYQPQMQEVMRKLNKGTKFILSKTKDFKKSIGDEFMWDKKKYLGLGINLMTPIIKETLLNQGTEAMLTVKPDVVYSLLDEARKYLNKTPKKISKTVTETAYDRIRKSLADGIEAGESVSQLKDRVIEGYKSLEVYQAETIARTEVSRATNFATIDAFKQSGVVEGKEWVVTPDDRLCEFCEAMESEYNAKAGLDDNYFNKGDSVTGIDGGIMNIEFDDISGPPLHPNCRCVLKSVEKLVEKKQKEDELFDIISKEIDGI